VSADVAGFAAAARSRALAVYAVIAQLRDERRAAPKTSCRHEPTCPAADQPDHDAAKVIAHDYSVGYSVLCNGVVVFEDTGELVGTNPIEPHRPEPQHRGPAPHNPKES
jgi:hypothetical protein